MKRKVWKPQGRIDIFSVGLKGLLQGKGDAGLYFRFLLPYFGLVLLFVIRNLGSIKQTLMS